MVVSTGHFGPCRFVVFPEDALCSECHEATTVKKRKGRTSGFYSSALSAYLFCSSYTVCYDWGLLFHNHKLQTWDVAQDEWHLSSVLEIIVILHISALNLSGAQTLVIAVTSWPMLFEEIIMDSDNEGKRAWLHPTEYSFFLFFHFTVFPSLWKQLLKPAPHNYLSICLL